MLRRTFLAVAPLAAQTGLAVAPARPFPGSPILFSMSAGPAEGTWLGRRLAFGLDESPGRWTALAAVGMDVRPGPQILQMANGETHTVHIAPHVYRTGKLTVAPKFVQPPKAVLARIAEEREVKKTAFAVRSKRAWSGAFADPAGTPQTSPFGTRRTYNGKTQSVHQGLDFRAAIGTPVHATNAGRVLIAREMYYEGGFVVLDHGEGLFSLYMHLSAFDVAEGAAVTKGERLALSGGSGRVTGPHLHFAIQWQGLYMEPATLLGLRV